MFTTTLSAIVSLSLAQTPAAVVAKNTAPFKVLQTFEVGGDGGWDCVTVDSQSHRLFVPRGTHVMVIDTESGKVVGDIANTAGVHCVALVPSIGKGFTSNGKSGDVTVFDMNTLKTERTIPAGKGPDVAAVEPITKRVFVLNAKSNDATVISSDDLSVVGTIALGSNPEFAAMDGRGNVFINLEGSSEIVRVDAKTMKVEQRIALKPGEEPTGLAIDVAHGWLFAACSNQMMVVVDIATGKILATPAIGKGVDGAGFMDAGGYAISSNGEGSITVVDTRAEKPFTVAQTLETGGGARTMVIDQKTRRIYLPSAQFEPPAPDAKPGKWPKMKPGTFKIVVVGPNE